MTLDSPLSLSCPSNSCNVFLTWNGQGMKTCQITSAAQSILKKVEIDTKITWISFHKPVVTKIHTQNLELRGKLVGLMAHTEAKEKKHYLLSDESRTTVEASRKLGKHTGANEVCDKDKGDHVEEKLYWESAWTNPRWQKRMPGNNTKEEKTKTDAWT